LFSVSAETNDRSAEPAVFKHVAPSRELQALFQRILRQCAIAEGETKR
jgi:hypothetical protein